MCEDIFCKTFGIPEYRREFRLRIPISRKDTHVLQVGDTCQECSERGLSHPSFPVTTICIFLLPMMPSGEYIQIPISVRFRSM